MSKIKSLAIIYEIPYFNEKSLNVVSLNKKIYEEYLDYLDVIRCELFTINLGEFSTGLVFNLVAIDNNQLTNAVDKYKDYNEMTSGISKIIELELSEKNLLFKRL